jgi:hypothetical protein
VKDTDPQANSDEVVAGDRLRYCGDWMDVERRRTTTMNRRPAYAFDCVDDADRDRLVLIHTGTTVVAELLPRS